MALRGVAQQANTGTSGTLVLALTAAISGITNANPAVVTLSSTAAVCPFGIGSQITVSGVSGMTGINGQTAPVTAIGGSSGAWQLTLAIDSTSFGTYTSGGTAAIVPVAGDVVVLHGAFGGSGAPRAVTATGFSAPAGFTPFAENGRTFAVLTGTSAGGETSFTVTVSGSADHHAGQCTILSGRSGVMTALSSTGPSSLTNTPLSLSITGLTANGSDDVLLVGMSDGNNTYVSVTWTPPSGYVDGNVAWDTTSFIGIAYMALNPNVVAGPTGTLSATLSWTPTGGNTQGYGVALMSFAASPTWTPHMNYGLQPFLAT